MRLVRCSALAIVLLAPLFLNACATTPVPVIEDEDLIDFSVSGNTLMRGTHPFPVRAIDVPALAAGGAELSNIASPMARIAESGGNTVAFDLPGLSADGAALDATALANVQAIIQRAEDQHMCVLLDLLGAAGPESHTRLNAVITAAKAFDGEHRVVYLIDGADAAGLVHVFKRHTEGLVVAAPENGDVLYTVAEPDVSVVPVMLAGALPKDIQHVSFLLSGADADYSAMDAALTTPEEKAGWVPDNSTLGQAERDEGYIALFNGKNLDGWWVFGENKEGFRVTEEGAIERAGEKGLALMTVNRYDNFILRLEYKIEQGGNSGVFVRAPRMSRQSRIGMEVQIHGDEKEAPTDDAVGAIYKVVPPTSNASKPAGEWNELEIMLDHRHARVTLNGTVVQNINLDDYEELKYRLTKGFIGLQDHDSLVQFKNVRLKPL